jgi:putative transcriptional regulator
MSKNKIAAGLKEALAFSRGDTQRARVTKIDVPDDIDVKAIRTRLNMSQKEFALRFGFPLGTLRNWEQNRRRPDGPARVLLTVIDKEPEAVERALGIAA